MRVTELGRDFRQSFKRFYRRGIVYCGRHDMNSKSKLVKRFFDNTQLYLNKDFGVSIRVLIVRDLLGNLNHSRILDLGCGDGRISLQYISQTNYITLVDLSDKMLDIARANTPEALKTNVNYINADLEKYETAEKFDIVLCIGVLAHVLSIEETIVKVSGFLKPGGRCIFQITDTDHCFGKFLRAFYWVRGISRYSNRYTLNDTRLSYIIKLTHLSRLILLDKRQYWSIFPGMGKMPNKWLWKYQFYTLTHDSLSQMGSEIILLYVRDL
jgi:2-polyprenyl-3-methyl-5-hydroxy-6-metoxy-1,4-benzoquinol methylase